MRDVGRKHPTSNRESASASPDAGDAEVVQTIFGERARGESISRSAPRIWGLCFAFARLARLDRNAGDAPVIILVVFGIAAQMCRRSDKRAPSATNLSPICEEAPGK